MGDYIEIRVERVESEEGQSLVIRLKHHSAEMLFEPIGLVAAAEGGHFETLHVTGSVSPGQKAGIGLRPDGARALAKALLRLTDPPQE